MKNKQVVFSIVFPVMNQEDHIERIIRAYHNELSKYGFSFELIAVVNGTTDNSFNVCRKVASLLPNVYAYELEDSGYGLGIIHGFKKACGKYYCYLNCARTYPDELVACLKYFLVNPNVIIHGVRKKRDIRLRAITSVVFNTTCKLLTGISSSDINGIPKVLSKQTYEKLNLKYKDSMIDLELLHKSRLNNIAVIEVPIYKNVRHGGQSTSNFSTSFRLLKELVIYHLKRW